MSLTVCVDAAAINGHNGMIIQPELRTFGTADTDVSVATNFSYLLIPLNTSLLGLIVLRVYLRFHCPRLRRRFLLNVTIETALSERTLVVEQEPVGHVRLAEPLHLDLHVVTLRHVHVFGRRVAVAHDDGAHVRRLT